VGNATRQKPGKTSSQTCGSWQTALQNIVAGSAQEDDARLECGHVQTNDVNCKSFTLSSDWPLKSMAKGFVQTTDSVTIAFEGVRQKLRSRAHKAHRKCKRSRGHNKET
jgi:hypothetical protein